MVLFENCDMEIAFCSKVLQEKFQFSLNRKYNNKYNVLNTLTVIQLNGTKDQRKILTPVAKSVYALYTFLATAVIQINRKLVNYRFVNYYKIVRL